MMSSVASNDRSVDSNNNLNEEEEDEHMDVPLVQRRQTRTSLEIISARREQEAEDAEDASPSCWSDTWKSVASLLLTAILLGPWIYKSYEGYQHEPASPSSSSKGAKTSILHETIPEFLRKADRLQCAKDLNISYSQLYLDIKKNRTNPCREKFTSRCNCPNPTIPAPFSYSTDGWSSSWWDSFHRNQQMAAAAYNHSRLNVVMLGDSITEHWLGTQFTEPLDVLKGVPELREQLFHGSMLPLGISGDECFNLLWRVQNGEMPESLQPNAFWILIGTNDYMRTCNREAILVGILAILEYVLSRTSRSRTKFVIQGLMPRDDQVVKGSYHQALQDVYAWNTFTWINRRLLCVTDALPARLSFFNGTDLFLSHDSDEVNQTLLYDYLHPSREGHRILGLAMIDHLKSIGAWAEE